MNRIGIATLAGLGLAAFALKAVRHSDEAAQLVIGPGARAMVEEVRHARIPAKDAISAAEALTESPPSGRERERASQSEAHPLPDQEAQYRQAGR